jgi:hypothetical protein
VNVEQTVPSDAEAIRRIAAMHETPAAARIIERWWEQLPESFRAIRDATGDLGGFYILIELGDKAIRLAENDPLMRSLRQHLRECPISKDETAVYVRRWLSSSNGELPSPVQAACWLDVKRPYMELRPHLRRCYFSVCDLATYGPTVQKLGARVVEGASVDLDDVTHHLAVVDFGPASIDGWLSGLVAAELGLDQGGILDIESRELLLDGKRIGLTALEFELFRYLYARQGKAVSRTELLEQVWECRSDSSSNVVDVVIQSLRKKMAGRATMIATVRGVGYRLGE